MSTARGGRNPAGRGVRRVRHRRTFERLAHSPHRGRSGPIIVGFLPESTRSTPEVAYVIGRPVGTAVERNRLRRRLRSILADAAPTLANGAYVVRAGPEAPGLAFDELRQDVERALEHARDQGGGPSPAGPAGTGRRVS